MRQREGRALRIVTHRRTTLTAGADEVWATLTRTEDYRVWWPWLRRLEVGGFVAGARWECGVRAPLPYTVSFSLTITAVEQGRSVAATVQGDIAGTASVRLEPDGAGTTLVLDSTLRPVRRGLVLLSVVAAPVARRGHGRIIDVGLQQFEDQLRPSDR